MLEIQSLSAGYETKSSKFFHKNKIKAVENVNLTISQNKTIGLVGESGCGKSTLGRTIIKLHKADSGSIKFHGTELIGLKNKEMLGLRKKIQMIFQDPYSSLNPRMTIFEIVSEGLKIHAKYSKTEIREKTVDILEKMSLKKDILYRYPHEFSGGQRQRIAIARVLVLNPEFVVCDEIVSALDVSTQAQVINLVAEFKQKQNLSLLFISHDLSVVSYIADEIAVMYLGKIVEFASKENILKKPLHPYTNALFLSVFELKNRKKKRAILEGEIPGVFNKPTGCYFHTRCPLRKDICKVEIPKWEEVEKNHWVACHFAKLEV
ncbi:MAG: ABC transporter ATP-binding protein [Leptospiraceae bacterium]|nr:ABC transporter ATP-binding protein [Leptospiraceae bacterium]MCP5495050.1 ABC transporter ATP-binding protein [Leptospiraceae bacterium]